MIYTIGNTSAIGLIAKVAVNGNVVDRARLNFKCPKCKDYNLSDFQPVKLEMQT